MPQFQPLAGSNMQNTSNVNTLMSAIDKKKQAIAAKEQGGFLGTLGKSLGMLGPVGDMIGQTFDGKEGINWGQVGTNAMNTALGVAGGMAGGPLGALSFGKMFGRKTNDGTGDTTSTDTTTTTPSVKSFYPNKRQSVNELSDAKSLLELGAFR